ncbi:MAG TPA: class I SAM-dependent methyltransferase, partial [Bacteroidota bacterium]|nr:class I SAM-dependent methyltransferase [Bacteroidota bacterium]
MDQGFKNAVREFWDRTPCGTRDLAGLTEGSREFFNRLEAERQAREEFIERFAQFSRWRGQRVLEVGVGAATDFIRFARAGAVLSGIDLTAHAVELAEGRLRLEALNAEVRQGDAENLPFPDASFDFVYSWGVIHHTADTGKAAQELIRVTKPGGRVCAMIYHRRSLVALQCWVLHALLRGRPWLTFTEVIRDHIESPGTKAYSIREAEQMFEGLVGVQVTPVVTPYDVRLSRSQYLPRWMADLVPSRWGWFLVVEGTK